MVSPPVTGLILAGGRGRRMGGLDKGWVPWQGRALVEHVIERLLPQVQGFVISANRNLARYRSLGHPVVEDDQARFGVYPGPLAGMLAGLAQASTPWMACVPCDAPALPHDLVARLWAAAGDSDAPALAVAGGRRQPVFCLLPRALAPRLARALAEGEHRPSVFLEGAGAVEVFFEDEGAFANINAAAAGDAPAESTDG